MKMSEIKEIVIGSYVLTPYYSIKTKPKDLDILTNDLYYETMCERYKNRGEKVEIHKNNKIFDILKETIPILPNLSNEIGIISPKTLYTLKASHMFWDIKWDKHLSHIVSIKEKSNFNIIESLFYKLYNVWVEIHGEPKRSKLKMSSKEFFERNVLDLETDHDYLHTLLKDVPTYTKILKDGEEVDVCEEKFNKLSFKEKIDLVKEEVYVMGYERYKHLHYKVAYIKMLKKFVRSHAPLWEAIFILENFKELSRDNFDFITYLNEKLNDR